MSPLMAASLMAKMMSLPILQFLMRLAVWVSAIWYNSILNWVVVLIRLRMDCSVSWVWGRWEGERICLTSLSLLTSLRGNKSRMGQHLWF